MYLNVILHINSQLEALYKKLDVPTDDRSPYLLLVNNDNEIRVNGKNFVFIFTSDDGNLVRFEVNLRPRAE